VSVTQYLAKKFNVPADFIERSIRMAPRAYKEFYIDKKGSNEKRAVHQPSRKIKALQRVIINDFLNRLPVHDAVFSYREGISIFDNASVHRGCRYLLRLDFVKFFESIKKKDIYLFLLENRGVFPEDFSDGDIELISHLASFYDDVAGGYRLVIGSPMSPVISNSILYGHDSAISDYCARVGVRYSRYADDLFFSANEKNLLGAIPRIVARVLGDFRAPVLTINEQKTIHTSKKHSMRVTGIVLASDGSISIGRDRKREIKALLHRLSMGELPAEVKPYLTGLLAYVNSIEPEFLQRLEVKYGAELLIKARSCQG